MTPLTHTRATSTPRIRSERKHRSKSPRKLFLDFLESRQLLSGGVVVNQIPPSIGDVYFNTQPNAPVAISAAPLNAVYYDSRSLPLSSVQITSLPAHGTLTLNASPVNLNQSFAPASLSNLTYMPAAGYAGPDFFQWEVSDGSLTSRPANVWLTVGSNPTADIDVSKSVSTVGDNGFLPQEWSAGFIDSAQGQYLEQIQINSLPSHGTIEENRVAVSAGQIVSGFSNIELLSYAPTPGYTGPDSFQWTGSDSTNTAPTPSTFTLSVFTPTVTDLPPQDVAQNFPRAFFPSDFVSSFSSAKMSLSQIQITSYPAHGSLTYNSAFISPGQAIPFGQFSLSQLIYTPENGYIGADAFSWTASDGVDGFAPVSATAPLNVLPISVANMPLQASANVPLPISPLFFETLIFAGSFVPRYQTFLNPKIEITSLPSHGLLATSPNGFGADLVPGQIVNSSFYYTPQPGYFGNDTFGWTASIDGTNFASPAQVQIAVSPAQNSGNSAPLLSDISAIAIVSGVRTIQLSEFNSAFTDAGQSIQSIQIVTLPAHGTLAVNGTPVTAGQTFSTFPAYTPFTYTPDSGYSGSDSFQWNASDGSSFATSPAAFNLTVIYPSLNFGILSAHYLAPNTSFAVPLTTFNSVEYLNSTEISLVEFSLLPIHGTLTINGSPAIANQTYSLNAANITYTPAPGYSGGDLFAWNGADGPNGFGPNPATFLFTVEPDPTVSDFSEIVASGARSFLPLSDFNSHFSEGNMTLGQIQITSLTTHGTLYYLGSPATANQTVSVNGIISASIAIFSGNLTIQSPNSPLSYIPNPGYTGTDSFTWTGADSFAGNPFAATSANVTINVVNPPVVTDFSKSESVPTTGSFTLADFTSHYSDPSNAALQSVTITALPTKGTLQLAGVGVTANQIISAASLSNLTYSPSVGGIDVFKFTASDGTISSAPANVTLTVASPPTLLNGNGVVLANGSFNVVLNGNTTHLTAVSLFSDLDGDSPAAVKIIKLPANGQLLLSGKPLHAAQILSPAQFGLITYKTSKPVTTDSFKFNISDGASFAASDATFSFVASTTPLTVVADGTPISSNQKPAAANCTDFGTWAVAANPTFQPDTRAFTLYNTGNTTLNLFHLTFSGPAAKDFSFVNPAINLSLTPGQSATLTLQFLPKAAGTRLATLTLPGTDAKHAFLLQLAGTGVAGKTIRTDPAGAGGIVQVATTQAGNGHSGAANGQIVSVTYTMYLADGTFIDSSASHANLAKSGLTFRLDDAYAQGQPFINKDQAFLLEIANVDITLIPGWEFGLQGIKPGEKRTLILNANAGYGSQVNGTFPPNGTLRFDVQCLSITAKPQLLVAAIVPGVLFSVGAPPMPGPVAINPGQTTISTAAGTLLSLSANQTSTSQKFSLFSVFSDNANGTPLANITLSSINFSGPAARDFSIVRTGNLLTLTFHPTAIGARNATVHIHSSDPVHPDFTFAVQGTRQTSLALVKTT